MALESLKAEIGLILETFSNPPHDRYELYVQLKEKLNEMRVFGMTPPDDLLEFEEALDEEFAGKRRELHQPGEVERSALLHRNGVQPIARAPAGIGVGDDVGHNRDAIRARGENRRCTLKRNTPDGDERPFGERFPFGNAAPTPAEPMA